MVLLDFVFVYDCHRMSYVFCECLCMQTRRRNNDLGLFGGQFGLDLGSIWSRSGVDLGAELGSIWVYIYDYYCDCASVSFFGSLLLRLLGSIAKLMCKN